MKAIGDVARNIPRFFDNRAITKRREHNRPFESAICSRHFPNHQTSHLGFVCTFTDELVRPEK